MILDFSLRRLNYYIIGFLPLLFYFFSHMSFLEDSVKQVLFILSLLINALILFFLVPLDLFYNKKMKISSVMLLVITIYIYIYSVLIPPLNEYGYDKINYIYVVVFLVFSVTYISFRNRYTVLSFIYFLAIFSLFFCFLSIVLQVDENNLRKSSIGLNPTIMAKACSILAIFSTAQLLFKKKPKFYIWSIVLLLLSFFAIFKTGSRGPLLSYMLSLFFLYYLMNGLTRSLKIVLIIPFFILIFYFILGFLPEELSARYSLDAVSIEENSDEGDRIQLWGLAFTIISKNLMGIGSGNFLEYSFVAVPHNFFLEIAVEYGLLASILIFLIVIRAFINMLDSVQNNLSFINIFFSFMFLNQLVNALLGNELSIQSYIFYICIVYFLFNYYKNPKLVTQIQVEKYETNSPRHG